MSREDSVRQSAIGGAQFPWLPGEVGEWLVDRFSEWGSGFADADEDEFVGGIGEHLPAGAVGISDAEDEALGHIVPAGFSALIRILHPFTRTRPISCSWEEFDSGAREPNPDVFPDFVDESVSWRETAGALGTGGAFGPSVRSGPLLGRDDETEEVPPASDGWRYSEPAVGSLASAHLERVAAVLVAHTATPGRGVAAIWDGYGGLVSAQGVGFFVFFPEGNMPAWLSRATLPWVNRWAGFLARRRQFGMGAAIRAALFPRAEQPIGSGLLSKAAATGSRLELPGRDYICFSAGIADFRTPRWKVRAPWLGPDGYHDEHPQTPNLIWPRSREWVLVSEIDFDSTLIACSREAADALLATPGIEAVEITRDTALWAE